MLKVLPQTWLAQAMMPGWEGFAAHHQKSLSGTGMSFIDGLQVSVAMQLYLAAPEFRGHEVP